MEVVRYSMPKVKMKKIETDRKGLQDVLNTFEDIRLPLYLAWADIRQRYRRSVLGPFWITISTAVMVACLGFIFNSIFNSSLELFLPFIATGLIVWGFISSCIVESTTVFTTSEPIIKQLPIPLFCHVVRMLARNFYIFLHNLIILPFVLLLVGRPIEPAIFLFIFGLILVVFNLSWLSLFLGVICARYRDLTQIVANVLQIFFYVTPIIWLPNALKGRANLLILDSNPFYHLMEVVRAPVMGYSPTLANWLVCASMAILGWIFTIFVFNRYKTKVAYWL